MPNSIELVSVERMILHYPPSTTALPAPTELVSAARMILHHAPSTTALPAPTELVSAERMILHYCDALPLSAPHPRVPSAAVAAADGGDRDGGGEEWESEGIRFSQTICFTHAASPWGSSVRDAAREWFAANRSLARFEVALLSDNAPTELVSAERMILHYPPSTTALPAPTELVSAVRMILHYCDALPLSAPHPRRRGERNGKVKASVLAR